MSDKFQQAHARARQRIGAEAWSGLSNEAQEAAVARELRLLADESTAPVGEMETASVEGSFR
jgi:hypothetical protein